MRLISPALPGTAFLLSAAAEVSVLLAQGQAAVREIIPLWVSMIPGGVMLCIGGWAILRLFAHERNTDLRFAATKQELEEVKRQADARDDERHRENQAAIAALSAGQNEMKYLLMGIQGQGGLMEDRAKNQERRHELAQDITLIYAHLHYFGIWAAKVGEARGVPFDPPPMEKPRRRRGESDG